MKEKPKAKNRTPQRQVSTIHSINTFTVSRERQKPASNIVKPTCIQKTKNAATRVQTVLSGLTMSLPFNSGSAAKTLLNPSRSGKSATIPISSKLTPTIFPASRSIPYRRHSLSCSRTCNREIFCDRDNFFFMYSGSLKCWGVQMSFTELPCKRSIDDCLNSRVFDLIRNDHLDFSLWDKVGPFH